MPEWIDDYPSSTLPSSYLQSWTRLNHQRRILAGQFRSTALVFYTNYLIYNLSDLGEKVRLGAPLPMASISIDGHCRSAETRVG